MLDDTVMPKPLGDGHRRAGLSLFQSGAQACLWLFPGPAGLDEWDAPGSTGPAALASRRPIEVRVGLGTAELCP